VASQLTGTQTQLCLPPPQTYWDEVQGNTPEAAERRKNLDDAFSRYFPNGHGESLRQVVPFLKDLQRGDPTTRNTLPSWRLKWYMNYLDFIHPDALNFLQRHGTDYTPILWKKRPHIEPKPRHCFFNATVWMYAHNLRRQEAINEHWPPMTYVEGLVFGPTLKAPMLHAWNTYLGRGPDAVDFSLYPDCGWNRYFGIAFSQAEWIEICQFRNPAATEENPKPRLLFRRDECTPELLEKLESIISRRQETKTNV